MEKEKRIKYLPMWIAWKHPISIFGRLFWLYQSIVRRKRYALIKEDIRLLKLIHSLGKSTEAKKAAKEAANNESI